MSRERLSDLAHSMTPADTGSVSPDRVSRNLLKLPSLAKDLMWFYWWLNMLVICKTRRSHFETDHFCRWAMAAMTQRRLRWAWVILGGGHAGHAMVGQRAMHPCYCRVTNCGYKYIHLVLSLFIGDSSRLRFPSSAIWKHQLFIWSLLYCGVGWSAVAPHRNLRWGQGRKSGQSLGMGSLHSYPNQRKMELNIYEWQEFAYIWVIVWP